MSPKLTCLHLQVHRPPASAPHPPACLPLLTTSREIAGVNASRLPSFPVAWRYVGCAPHTSGDIYLELAPGVN